MATWALCRRSWGTEWELMSFGEVGVPKKPLSLSPHLQFLPGSRIRVATKC